ncbi:MAG: S-layer family protein [Leptolyngbyaceae cyanobacterium RU_5_1]|nr:S-layer family protein [Leptolyngbyaceae cyanobacterium RU_5_1]
MSHLCNPLALSSVFAIAAAFLPLPALAQVAGDGTLGTLVNGAPTTPCTGFCLITEGATRGSNLFHSFRQFSLPNGDVAGFVTTPAIQNVIVRVTGQGDGFISNINGTIATLDTVGNLASRNFFLLNPNGIVFGPNATLLNGGSFLATTAEQMLFQDGTVFSARDQTSTPLLTVSVPVGLQMGQTPGRIQSELQISAGINSLFTDFALVGSDVVLDGSIIVSPGRRVEISGLSAQGTVGLNLNDQMSLSFPDNVLRGNVTLRNGSVIDVIAAQGGEIAITGQNIRLDGSLLLSGVFGEGATRQAGDIVLNAADQVTIGGSSSTLPNSAIINAVFPDAVGNSGNVRIITGSLEMNDSAKVLVNTTGTGNAGNVLIQARDRVTLNNASTIESNVTQIGNGQGGNIRITANEIALNNSQIQSVTGGQGDAGSVRLEAGDRITVTGRIANAAAGIVTSVFQTATGRGGDIQISSGTLELADGAQLQAASAGRGIAGDIVIDVRDRVIFNNSQALSVLTNTGIGGAGAIRISANTLEVLKSESALQSSTAGLGNAGTIILNIRDRITVDGGSVLSFVDQGAVGQGGDIQVLTNVLEIMNRGQLNASTLGNGNAGSIVVNASDRIILDSADIVSYVESSAVGNGGTIQIVTKTLEASNQTGLNTSTVGAGSAGGILINIRDRLTFDDSFIASRALPGSTGNSNDLTVSANHVELINGAKFLATTDTEGNAGDIRINTQIITILGINPQTQEPSGIFSATLGAGKGGNIVVNADTFRLSGGALVDVRTVAAGDSGTIVVNANTVDLLNGGQLGASTQGSGKAGAITVNARNQVTIEGLEPTFNNTRLSASPNSGIVVRSLASGGAGDIFITTPQLRLNQGILNAQSATVDGGNINLNVGQLLLMRNGSLISATAGTAEAGGNGGNITINAPRGFIVGVKRENSDITANAFTGSGGRVNITAQGIYGLQFRPQLTPFSDITASSTFGISGTVILDTPDIDPSRGLQELPFDLVDPSEQIAQTCPRGAGSRELGTFIVTGRGSLPPTPTDLFPGSLSAKPLATLDESTPQPNSHRTPAAQPNSAAPAAIVEAQRIVKTASGEIFLVADAPTPMLPGSPALLDCP